MYANNVEILFWPNSQKLAKWMHADKQNREDGPDDPSRRRLVTGGPDYVTALETILGQFKQIDITLADDLANEMIEAAQEKDSEPRTPKSKSFSAS